MIYASPHGTAAAEFIKLSLSLMNISYFSTIMVVFDSKNGKQVEIFVLSGVKTSMLNSMIHSTS